MSKKIISTIVLVIISRCCMAFQLADTAIIHSHLKTITKTAGYRNYQNTQQLDKTADYIKSFFIKYADSVCVQSYQVNGQVYKNVICSFGTKNKKRIIVGAHYDVCGNQEGADDNASGVAGLLELARLLKGQKLNQRVDLVAYTLEEPPFFRTEHMGSYIHAQWLAANKIDVYGMLSMEMIGYFKDEKNSQQYPLGFLSWFYGNKGDYITLVKKFGAGKFADNFCKTYKSTKTIRTQQFAGPEWLTGVDFSDHLNYWKFGFSAIMITDTSFYRNNNYHRATDTIDTLDFVRMAKVINGVFKTLTLL